MSRVAFKDSYGHDWIVSTGHSVVTPYAVSAFIGAGPAGLTLVASVDQIRQIAHAMTDAADRASAAALRTVSVED